MEDAETQEQVKGGDGEGGVCEEGGVDVGETGVSVVDESGEKADGEAGEGAMVQKDGDMKEEVGEEEESTTLGDSAGESPRCDDDDQERKVNENKQDTPSDPETTVVVSDDPGEGGEAAADVDADADADAAAPPPEACGAGKIEEVVEQQQKEEDENEDAAAAEEATPAAEEDAQQQLEGGEEETQHIDEPNVKGTSGVDYGTTRDDTQDEDAEDAAQATENTVKATEQEEELAVEESNPSKSAREMLEELYETVTNLNIDAVVSTPAPLSWEKFRKSLGQVEIDWEGMDLDRTLVPLRVWIAAEIESNGGAARESSPAAIPFDEFYETLLREVSELELNVLEAVKLFRDLDHEQCGRVRRMDLKARLDESIDFAWENLGVYDTAVVDAHLFSADENDTHIRFEHFFNLLVQVAGRTLDGSGLDDDMDGIDDEDSMMGGSDDHLAAVSGEDIIKWVARDVGEWLEVIGFPQYREVFRVNRIDGRRLLRMPADHLPKLRVQKWDDIKAIIAEVKKLRKKVGDAGLTLEVF